MIKIMIITKFVNKLMFCCLLILFVLIPFSSKANKATKNVVVPRIISQLPGLTEICFELGIEKNLVGVTDFCVIPKGHNKIQSIGTINNPNLELVMVAKPDLILIQDSQKALINKYNKLGLKTVILNSNSVSNFFKTIMKIGHLTGKTKKAENLKNNIKKQFESIKSLTKNRNKVKSMVVVGHEVGSLRDIWVAGPDSFHNELLDLSGGQNIITESLAAYPRVSKEEILKRAPEVIIILKDPKRKGAQTINREIALWDDLAYIPAVKNNRICVLNSDWVFIPGPKMAEIVKTFYNCLFPGDKNGK